MEPTRPAPERALRPDDGRLARGRRSRARIREAARALFEERGFDRATLREIAARAGMGTSSIYRHVQSKEELLVQELADLQEEAWARFRRTDRRSAPARERIGRLFDAQHDLLARDADLTVVALRATTGPAARVSRRVLALQDRTVGLLAEILQAARLRGDLDRDVDVLAAARSLVHAATGGADRLGQRPALRGGLPRRGRVLGRAHVPRHRRPPGRRARRRIGDPPCPSSTSSRASPRRSPPTSR